MKCFICLVVKGKEGFSKSQLKKHPSHPKCTLCVGSLSQGKNIFGGKVEERRTGEKAIEGLLSFIAKDKIENESSTSSTSTNSSSSSNSISNIFKGIKQNSPSAKRKSSVLQVGQSMQISLFGKRKLEESDTEERLKKAKVDHSSGLLSKEIDDKVVYLSMNSAKRVRQLGDGNCLYRSLSFGLGRFLLSAAPNHAKLRDMLARWTLNNADTEINGAEIKKWIYWENRMNVQSYCNKQRGSGFNAWGGQVELCACANLFKVNVNVFEVDNRRQAYKRISCFKPDALAKKSISVLYVHGNHYDALSISDI